MNYERRYIRTYTGGKFFAFEPERGDIRIEDIAHGLGYNCRWGGHCSHWYPIAAHSIWCALAAPMHLRFEALMHDASEAFLCDIPAPFKRLLPQYKEVEKTVMVAIAKRFNFPYPPNPLVKRIDTLALYQERKALFPHTPPKEDVETIPRIAVPAGCTMPTWNWKQWEAHGPRYAEDTFLFWFNRLKP